MTPKPTVRIDHDVYEAMQAEAPDGVSVTKHINDRLRQPAARVEVEKAPAKKRRAGAQRPSRAEPEVPCPPHPPNRRIGKFCAACGREAY